MISDILVVQKTFCIRLNEHLKYKNNLNAALQKAFVKYGFAKFKFCIYEYFSQDSRIISYKYLTELETSYLSKFKLETLYNFSLIAHNNLGYKQTNESKLKISEPGDSNPVFVKIHSEETKGMMRKEREKD